MFYLTGLVSVISGGMWLLEPIVVKFYYGKKGKEAEADLKRTDMNAIPNNHKEASNDQRKNTDSW